MSQRVLPRWMHSRPAALLALCLVAGALAVLLNALAHAREESRACFCLGSLRHLATGALQYASAAENDQYHAPDLAALATWRTGLSTRFVCPSDTSPTRLPSGTPCSYSSAFALASELHRRLPSHFPDKCMMLWERECFHGDSEWRVAFFDGCVERVSESALDTLLEALNAEIQQLPDGLQPTLRPRPVPALAPSVAQTPSETEQYHQDLRELTSRIQEILLSGWRVGINPSSVGHEGSIWSDETCVVVWWPEELPFYGAPYSSLLGIPPAERTESSGIMTGYMQFTFRVVPYLSPQDYVRKKAKNEEIRTRLKEYDGRLKKIAKPGRKPSGSNPHGFHPTDEAGERLLAERQLYWRENPTYRLPTHSYGEHSFRLHDARRDPYCRPWFIPRRIAGQVDEVLAKIGMVAIPYGRGDSGRPEKGSE